MTLYEHMGTNKLAKEFKASLTKEELAIINKPFGRALLSARSILFGDLKVLAILTKAKKQQILQDIIEQYEDLIAEQITIINNDRIYLSTIEKEYFKAVK